MVDVDRRPAGLALAQAAAFRRLSARAAALGAATNPPAAAAPTRTSHRNGLLSFSPLAEAVLSHLRSLGVAVLPGLSDADLARAEAELGAPLPPDLRALLALGLPAGAGFPDWRLHRRLRAALDAPVAAISVQVARGSFWHRSWGARSADPAQALRAARCALRRVPPLVPLFGRCYIPCRPCLAGNPVFFVGESCVSCCALDLADFFQRENLFSSPPSSDVFLRQASAGTPRWVEFWRDAACNRQRRNSSSSSSCSSSSELLPRPLQPLVEVRPTKLPGWASGFLDDIDAALREGGWGESDVNEMLHAPSPPSFAGPVVLETLLLKAEGWAESLRWGGWSAEEVSDALGFDLRLACGRERRPAQRKLLPEVAQKVERPSQDASTC